MPLYTYELPCGKKIERIFTVQGCPDEVQVDCPCMAKKIIDLGHGGIQRLNPVWLDQSVLRQVQDSDLVASGAEAKIENRHDLDRHLKKHGIVAVT